MKRYFIFLLIILLTECYAQAQFAFGIRTGLNLTYESFIDNTVVQKTVKGKTETKPGIQFGVVGEYAFPNSFGIQSGFLLYTHGSKTFVATSTFGTPKIIYEYRITDIINYFRLPVNVQYKLDLGNLKLLFQAGPYLGIALNGNRKTEIKMIEIIYGMYDDEFDGSRTYYEKIKFGKEVWEQKRHDYGLGLSFGAQSGNIQTVVGYNKGLLNLSRADWNSWKNDGLAITLTYLFGN